MVDIVVLVVTILGLDGYKCTETIFILSNNRLIKSLSIVELLRYMLSTRVRHFSFTFHAAISLL